MRAPSFILSLWIISISTVCHASRNFTIVNGQIYTPGLAIVNAPQPFTPLGGETLHISIDVSGNGCLPPYTYQAFPNGTIPMKANITRDDESTAEITLTPSSGTYYHSLNIFLYSYENNQNFTVSNGTLPPLERNNSYVAPVLGLEPGSTVKHVNWIWPECLRKGDGDYNISIHQSFVYNSTEYYTIFDLPITMTNDLDPERDATECDELNNFFLDPEDRERSISVLGFQPWVNGTGAQVQFDDEDSKSSDARRVNALGGSMMIGLVGWVALVGSLICSL